MSAAAIEERASTDQPTIGPPAREKASQARRLFATARRRQLAHAIDGRIAESARFASRARRVEAYVLCRRVG